MTSRLLAVLVALTLALPGAARAQDTTHDEYVDEGPGPDEAVEPDGEQVDEAEAADAAEDDEAEEEEADEAVDETAEEAQAEEGQDGDANEGDDVVDPTPVITRFIQPTPAPGQGDFQLTLPPVLIERRAGVATTAVFPLFYLREEPGSSELVIPPIYHREGPSQADVFFPMFWWFRGQDWHTWIVPPVWSHSDPNGHDFGIAPLFMTGRNRDSYYHAIPPLLTVAWGNENEDYLFSAALFYRLRNREQERWGVFPFLWWYDSPEEQYQFVAPFVFRRHDSRAEQTLTIVPPALFYLSEQPRESWWGIAGLLHHDEGPGFHSTTIPPLLFHFSEEAPATAGGRGTMRLSTPLFLYMNERGSETFVTWLYQRYRGATELDAVAPLFWWIRDPRDHSETIAVAPIFLRWSSPATSNTIVFPFFGHFDEYGRRQTWVTPLVANTRDLTLGDETTWILPTIQISRWHDGDAVNIHPLWYYESVPSHRHSVLFPFWFDFEQLEKHDRYTVAGLLYWRFVEGVTETQVFLNTYFRRREWRAEQRWEYEFHLAPLFDYGERSDGEHWWRVLYGLVGWEHRASHDRLWLFYIPIDFGHAPPAPAAAPSAMAPPTWTQQ